MKALIICTLSIFLFDIFSNTLFFVFYNVADQLIGMIADLFVPKALENTYVTGFVEVLRLTVIAATCILVYTDKLWIGKSEQLKLVFVSLPVAFLVAEILTIVLSMYVQFFDGVVSRTIDETNITPDDIYENAVISRSLYIPLVLAAFHRHRLILKPRYIESFIFCVFVNLMLVLVSNYLISVINSDTGKQLINSYQFSFQFAAGFLYMYYAQYRYSNQDIYKFAKGIFVFIVISFSATILLLYPLSDQPRWLLSALISDDYSYISWEQHPFDVIFSTALLNSSKYSFFIIGFIYLYFRDIAPTSNLEITNLKLLK